MIKQKSYRKICYGGVFILIIISGMYFITGITYYIVLLPYIIVIFAIWDWSLYNVLKL